MGGGTGESKDRFEIQNIEILFKEIKPPYLIIDNINNQKHQFEKSVAFLAKQTGYTRHEILTMDIEAIDALIHVKINELKEQNKNNGRR